MTEPTDRNDDRTPAEERSPSDDTPARDGGGSGDGATRRRRRGSRGGRGRGRDTSSDASGSDASGSDAQGSSSEEPSGRRGDASRGGDASDGDDGSRRRRGRRGRRGRGGGGGGSSDAAGSATADETAEAGASEPAADGGTPTDGASPAGGSPKADASSEDRSTKSSSSRSGSSRGGSSRGGGARGGGSDGGSEKRGSDKGGQSKDGSSDGGSSKESARSSEDEATAEAIAKGGTRVAAKQRGKRGGGGGGGNGNGRGRNQRPGGVPEEVRRAILEGPPRTMLVTNREDRTQIAVLEDRTVCEHYVTRKKDVTFVGNIYMARVQNVLPGMEAAFLDIGKGRNGVLYAGEVLYDELDLEEGADERIENALKPGQKVLVQVTKDPMGSKGPRLTMHLSLAGRYSVLAPNSDLFGISRKLTDKERDRLRRIVKKVKPDHHGVIVRTAAENASEEQLTADLERLLTKWTRVEEAAADAKALTPVYEEPPLVVKVIRDNFGPEFERCIVDDEDLYHQVRGYLEEVAPELTAKVELYGQPTADARARAAGAPALEDASEDPSTADAATVVADAASGEDGSAASDGATAEDTTNDADTAGADEARSDAAATDRWDTEGGSDGAEAATAAPDTAGSAAAESTPVVADDDATVVATTVDLEAARARREHLPRLFDAYDVADQLRKATSRKVWLPSGGYLIIESTEAMKVIDVNSGKFTGSGDMNLEEVVLRTNLEAADEIVRQLRLRDMGGIIVIDFIDMLLKANQDQVVRRLKRELLRDRTKTRVSEVSRLGLVQMTRKNVSQGLVEAFSHTCEHCEGRGLISELD